MITYCIGHAIEEMSMIEYYDPNRKLGKTVYRIPTRRNYKRCGGRDCKKKGLFFVGFIRKTIAQKEDRIVAGLKVGKH